MAKPQTTAAKLRRRLKKIEKEQDTLVKRFFELFNKSITNKKALLDQSKQVMSEMLQNKKTILRHGGDFKSEESHTSINEHADILKNSSDVKLRRKAALGLGRDRKYRNIALSHLIDVLPTEQNQDVWYVVFKGINNIMCNIGINNKNAEKLIQALDAYLKNKKPAYSGNDIAEKLYFTLKFMQHRKRPFPDKSESLEKLLQFIQTRLYCDDEIEKIKKAQGEPFTQLKNMIADYIVV